MIHQHFKTPTPLNTAEWAFSFGSQKSRKREVAFLIRQKHHQSDQRQDDQGDRNQEAIVVAVFIE